MQPGDVQHTLLILLYKRLIGIVPKTSLKDGIKTLLIGIENL